MTVKKAIPTTIGISEKQGLELAALYENELRVKTLQQQLDVERQRIQNMLNDLLEPAKQRYYEALIPLKAKADALKKALGIPPNNDNLFIDLANRKLTFDLLPEPQAADGGAVQGLRAVKPKKQPPKKKTTRRKRAPRDGAK